MLLGIAILIGCYLLGSITTGDIVAAIKKVNLRNQGSGNIGATNAFRTMGSVSGAIVLVGDALKGVIAVILGSLIPKFHGFDPAIIAGVLVIAGHNWPIFANFRGGKGIATSLGVIIALTPLSLIVIIPAWIIVFLCFGYVSLASIMAAVFYPVGVYFFYQIDPYKIGFSILIAVLALYRHRSNFKRLATGEEHRILYQNRKGATKK
ncbi:MAG TPA: glycerol-3-phosphate 1-O-acyltransferase PlsY [Bacillota bacterium]